MLRSTFSLLLAAAAMAGCSVAPPSAYTFDPTHPQPKPAMDAATAASITDRIGQLQGELDAVRTKIASETNAWNRLPLYSAEHRIHGELDPLQHQLSLYASAR